MVKENIEFIADDDFIRSQDSNLIDEGHNRNKFYFIKFFHSFCKKNTLQSNIPKVKNNTEKSKLFMK